MTRIALAALALAVCLSAGLDAQRGATKKPKKPCAVDLAHCPDGGCGTNVDANLNKAKNTIVNDGQPTLRTLAFIKKLDDPETYKVGDSRQELQGLGEGQVVTVAAYVTAVKAELGGESCNCGLHKPDETDNHLVLVTRTTVDKYTITGSAATQKKRVHSRELESVTAEFTPRVRPQHLHFTREFVQPLINKTTDKALLSLRLGALPSQPARSRNGLGDSPDSEVRGLCGRRQAVRRLYTKL